MIRFDSISKSYGGRTLFKNLSFSIGKGERCSLLGRNGTGKTTLLRLISGEETVDSGNIFIPKNYRIGMLAQHARWKAESALEEACLVTDAEWKASKMLFNLGFDDALLEGPISALSGGYSLRLQLAKLLLSEPDLLLLDEPTNYLDIKTIHWLETFLRKWPTEIISISHDRDFLDAISTHTMGLHRNELIRLPGTTAQYFSYILQKEEQHQKLLEKTGKQKANLQNFITRFGAKASKAKQAQSKQKMMDKLPQLEALAHIYALDFNFRESPSSAEVLINLDSVGFSYPDKPELFDDLSLTITPESRICFAGRNGRGKSTLLKLVRGDLTPTSGTIKFHPGCKIGYFGQTNIDRLNPQHTIEEEIATATPGLSYEQIKSIAGVMMFTQDDSKKRISVLSGGEKSRVLLAKILATPVNILLLDEPTNHLDIESIEALAEAIENFQGAVCLVTHSEMLLSRLSDTLVIFEDEKVFVFPDDYATFIETQGWKDEEAAAKSVKKETSEKHLRAQTVKDRSQLLGPIRKEIERLEKNIELLEKEKSEVEKKLVESLGHPASAPRPASAPHPASVGHPASLEQLSRRLKLIEEAIEASFLLLEEAETQRLELQNNES